MFKSRHEKRERGGVTEEGAHSGAPLSPLSWRPSLNLNQMVEPNSRLSAAHQQRRLVVVVGGGTVVLFNNVRHM